MDYNQQNQDNNYYNTNNYQQPTNYSQTPQNSLPQKRDALSIASMVCGIISVVMCCCGILSLPFGALGILFALLTRRKGKSMDSMSVAGISTSVIGMICGIAFLIYSLSTSFANMDDPAYREEFYDTMEDIYGEEMADYVFDFYGWD